MALLALVAVEQIINSSETFWMFSIGINNINDMWFESPCAIKVTLLVRSIEERLHSCLNSLMSVILPINQETYTTAKAYSNCNKQVHRIS